MSFSVLEKNYMKQNLISRKDTGQYQTLVDCFEIPVDQTEMTGSTTLGWGNFDY